MSETLNDLKNHGQIPNRCMKDFCASLSSSAIVSNKTFAVPLPSPASFYTEWFSQLMQQVYE